MLPVVLMKHALAMECSPFHLFYDVATFCVLVLLSHL